MQIQRLAFNAKHKEKLSNIARQQAEKTLHLEQLAVETEYKLLESDRTYDACEFNRPFQTMHD